MSRFPNPLVVVVVIPAQVESCVHFALQSSTSEHEFPPYTAVLAWYTVGACSTAQEVKSLGAAVSAAKTGSEHGEHDVAWENGFKCGFDM